MLTTSQSFSRIHLTVAAAFFLLTECTKVEGNAADSDTVKVVNIKNVNPEIFDRSGQNILAAVQAIQKELEETSVNLQKVKEVEELAEESMKKLKQLDVECKQRSEALMEAERGDLGKLQRLLGVVRQKEEVEERINSQLQEILSHTQQPPDDPG